MSFRSIIISSAFCAGAMLVAPEGALADMDYEPRTYLYEQPDWEDSEDVVYGYDDDLGLVEDDPSLDYEDWDEDQPYWRSERVFGSAEEPDLGMSGDEWEEGYYYDDAGELQHGLHREELDYSWEVQRTKRLRGVVEELNLIRRPGENGDKIV